MTKTKFNSTPEPTQYVKLDDTFWRRIKAIPRLFSPKYRTKEELITEIHNTRLELQPTQQPEQFVQRKILQEYIHNEFNETNYDLPLEERVSALFSIVYPEIDPTKKTKPNKIKIAQNENSKQKALALIQPVNVLVSYLKDNGAKLICSSLENYPTHIEYEIVMEKDPYFAEKLCKSHELKKQGFLDIELKYAFAKAIIHLNCPKKVIPKPRTISPFIVEQEIFSSVTYLANKQVKVYLLNAVENFPNQGLIRDAPFVDLTDIYKGDKK